MFSSVDFPQPLGPIRQMSSPCTISSEVSRNARTCRMSVSSPNRCETPATRIATSFVVMPSLGN